MGFSQEKSMDSLLKIGKEKLFNDKLTKLIIKNKDSNVYYYYTSKLHLQNKDYRQSLENLFMVDTLVLSKKYLPWYYYTIGESYRYLNNEELAYKNKRKAQELFYNIGDEIMGNQMNLELHYTLKSQEFLSYKNNFLDQFYKNAKELNDAQQIFGAHIQMSMLSFDPSRKDTAYYHLQQAKKYLKEISSEANHYTYYNYLWAYDQFFTQDYEKALMSADSSYYYAKKIDWVSRQESALKNRAVSQRALGNIEQSIALLLKADSLPLKEQILIRKKQLYQYLAIDYESLNQPLKALEYLKKKNSYENQVKVANQNVALTMYRAQSLSEENEALNKEKIFNRNLFLTVLILLFMVVAFTIFLVKYLHKKKLLSEKEKELKIERIEKKLREQELNNINARYEEREKERKRMAEDLHDDIGSLLTTIKLYFQNLKMKKERLVQEEKNLMQKANDLLDEAYDKVRNFAHVEDAAASISDGLVNSVTNFAIRITQSENLIVDVHENGIYKELKRNVEKDLFRVLKELITNVMKHAEATEVNIEFTYSEKNLNIIVEDNGKGFNLEILNSKEGMGLDAVDKKISDLNGKMIIESVRNNGTTIIIDIPMT